MEEDLKNLASLMKQRNRIEVEGSRIIGRPFLMGHIGEYIASKIFDISLHKSAAFKGNDGLFNSGLLKGCTVNIKFYGKQERILDLCLSEVSDYYLVMIGTRSINKNIRPWSIGSIYLFKTDELLEELTGKVKIGIATSVRKEFWEKAMIYPDNVESRIMVTDAMKDLIHLFSIIGMESS